MTIEIKIFDTWEDAKIEIKKRAGIWRPFHHDLIANKWKITFVDGLDDPDKTPEVEAKREKQKLKQQRIIILNKKQKTEDLNISELNELGRLEQG